MPHPPTSTHTSHTSPPSVPRRPLTPTERDRDPRRLLTEQEAQEAIQEFYGRCKARVAAL